MKVLSDQRFFAARTFALANKSARTRTVIRPVAPLVFFMRYKILQIAFSVKVVINRHQLDTRTIRD